MGINEYAAVQFSKALMNCPALQILDLSCMRSLYFAYFLVFSPFPFGNGILAAHSVLFYTSVFEKSVLDVVLATKENPFFFQCASMYFLYLHSNIVSGTLFKKSIVITGFK